MLRAATRGSPLARLQTALVAELLDDRFDTAVEPLVVETTGDRNADAAIWSMGGQGVFVKEVQAAVLDGRADIAVHSAKDLPSLPVEGLVLAAVPERGDPRDALVGSTLDGLPVGGRVATGSVRRRAQLAYLRPDLTFAGLRGNIDTRLRKAADFDAIVMAAAALNRLGRSEVVSELLDPGTVVPQVGQGALAVECRAGDARTRDALAAIDDPPSRRAVDSERAWLREIGSGCSLPLGAFATVAANGTITLTAALGSLDGRVMLHAHGAGDDPDELGARLARELLDGAGGRALVGDLLVGTVYR
jgi:hydroxymethylbilane synthase